MPPCAILQLIGNLYTGRSYHYRPQRWPPNHGQVAKVDLDLRRTIHDDDAQTVYG